MFFLGMNYLKKNWRVFYILKLKASKKLVLIFPQYPVDASLKLILMKPKLIKTVTFLTFKRDKTLMPVMNCRN